AAGASASTAADLRPAATSPAGGVPSASVRPDCGAGPRRSEGSGPRQGGQAGKGPAPEKATADEAAVGCVEKSEGGSPAIGGPRSGACAAALGDLGEPCR